MTNKVLMGLAGRGTINGEFASTARVGKDEVARVLKEDLGFRLYSFALPLKQSAQVLFGLTEEQMWNDACKNVVIDSWGLSPRTIFQRLGTEGARNVFDESMWAKMALNVWDDVKEGRPYALTHTASITENGDNPVTQRDFESLLRMAAQTMFQLSDAEIVRSQSMQLNLKSWSFTFDDVVEGIKNVTIPSVLDMPADKAWDRFVEIRKTLPTVFKCSNGPYSDPPAEAYGMVVPDNRFNNEANIIRDEGGVVVHVCRELPAGIELVQGHASELGVTPMESDIFIQNDGTLEQLRKRTHALVQTISPGFETEQKASSVSISSF